MIREIGDPLLRRVAAPVESPRSLAARHAGRKLKGALAAFQRAHGFGRAIAAPQIGIAKRMVAMDLGAGPFLLINPVLVPAGKRTVTMWDDCMSFPGLLVRVRRFESVRVRYVDERGRRREMRRPALPVAELLQHEVDHLDGVLAVDRALGRRSVVTRRAFEGDFERYRARVDYVIEGQTRRRPPGDVKRARPRRPAKRGKRV